MKKAGASNSALGTPHALSPKVLYRAWTPAKNQKQYKMKGLKDSFADKKKTAFRHGGLRLERLFEGRKTTLQAVYCGCQVFIRQFLDGQNHQRLP